MSHEFAFEVLRSTSTTFMDEAGEEHAIYNIIGRSSTSFEQLKDPGRKAADKLNELLEKAEDVAFDAVRGSAEGTHIRYISPPRSRFSHKDGVLTVAVTLSVIYYGDKKGSLSV